MKMFCLIALAAVTVGTAARAGSNTNAASQLRLTDIYSDSADFDGNGHTATYRGNVRVIASDIKLTCALLIADLPASGGRLSHVVAETNVVIDGKDSKGQTVHVTSPKAVYDYNVQNGVTNETVTLTGSPQPRVEDARGTQAADVIVWDRANNSYRFTGNYHFSPNLESALAATNPPPATNAPAATTNELTTTKLKLPPGADTNYPPGSLDLAPPQRTGGGHGF
jgi:lipopolysaccharide export system protein LptA